MIAMQGPEDAGIRGPGSVAEGASIPIDVTLDDVDTVLVSDSVPGSKPTKVPVGPGGHLTIPADPSWTAGTIITIYTSTSPVRSVVVEIVSTAP